MDPALINFGQTVSKEQIESKRKSLHLDAPLYVQIGSYLNDISPISYHENTAENQAIYHYWKILTFGKNVLVLKKPWLRESWQTGRAVSNILYSAVPQTAILALAAILLGLLIGIPAGITAALNHRKPLDTILTVAGSLGISLPGYVAGIALAYIFGVLWTTYTGLDHAGSLIDYNDEGEKIFVWKNLILPAVALGIRPVSMLMQLTRSAMLEALSQDYIRTARAKGLTPSSIIWKHAFRNSLNPLISATSGWFASLLTGAVFIEFVFHYKGLGTVLVEHLLAYDVPVVLAVSIFFALVFLTMNKLADGLYKWANP